MFLHNLCQNRPSMCSDIHSTECRPYGNQQTVLIDAVESVEPPKGVIPSLVWFDRIDSVYGILPHSMYFSVHSGLIFRGVIKDRKVNVTGVGDVSSPDPEQPIGQVVEGASEVLQDVPGDTGNLKRDGLNVNEVIDQLTRLRITLGRDFIGVGCLKGEDCRLQLLDMLVGPFDFKPD